ncbi:cell division protein FtsZ [Pendulispora brunnea]|uniref:Cell division protein FtsZ n=1 Tax=Pendulispora brunnea TaxID=2905690 RepID=A0ABZ2K315_9BACT
MSFSIEFADEQQEYQARIKVIGCGGSGGNAVNTMINFGLEGVEFIVVNTDAQALNANFAPTKLNIGNNVTKGLGAGADPERGRKAALEDVQRIKELISGADMVFVTAGMGGGTGTGAAPVIAQLAREEGALTVGVVTKPFLFEGRQRARRAEVGLSGLAEHVDTLITIPNQKLLLLGDEDLTFIDAFRKADEVLYQAVKGISDLITQNGIVNVDFADVKTVMSERGRALMGTGIAKGQNRARMAAEMAITSPLLDDISVEGATGILINIVGGPDLKMREIQEAASLVQEQAHEDANIIFGSSIDESLGENVKVTVIATGFDVADRVLLQEAAARGQLSTPQPIPTHQLRDSSYNMRAPAYPTMRPQAPAYPEPQQHVPAVSRRAPAPQYAQTQPSAGQQSRLPMREQPDTRRDARWAEVPESRGRAERSSSFPAFETDWDVPAFQRKHGG